MNYKNFYIVFIISLIGSNISAQNYLEREDNWVNATLNSMSLEQKIGQLFVVRAFSRSNALEEKVILDYIENYHIGGVCFFQGSIKQQVKLVNSFQSRARIPLFSAIDAEWGLGMRFPRETISFPKHTTLGAIEDLALIQEMGREIGRQCRRVGINVNFAPVVDINNNVDNPVIFDRSFGENPLKVTAKANAYIQGLEAEGVISAIKHFPGHGDTDTDSHKDLPIINKSRERLEEIELYPFRRLAALGVASIMVGHLNVPSLESRVSLPASLSSHIMTNFIRTEMSYSGLVVTDAMDMKGITKYYGSDGIAEAEAFMAGSDVILLPSNLPKAFDTIRRYVETGKISMDRLNESVVRILRAKFRIGLTYTTAIPVEGLLEDINSNKSKAKKQNLYSAALTLVSDEDECIPIQDLTSASFATLSINVHVKSRFQERIGDYVAANHYQWMPKAQPQFGKQLTSTLGQHSTVIIGIHTSGKRSAFNRDFPIEVTELIQSLSTKTKVILVLFGHPYLLSRIPDCPSIIVAYENDVLAQDASAQAIFGATPITGTLPVTTSQFYEAGTGVIRSSLDRLGFSLPEGANMDSKKLLEIDSLATQMIKDGATPGAQIFVARRGKVIYRKSFGQMTYGGQTVNNNTIYDIASITKILATTLATMKLVDDGLIDITSSLNTYIPNIDLTNKANLIIEDILAHHARLMPGIISYQNTLLPKRLSSYNTLFYGTYLHDNFNVPVAKNMFVRYDMKDTIWNKVYTSNLQKSASYRYSDIGLMLMQRVVEESSRQKLENYCSQSFYKPLGLTKTTFRPLEKFQAEIIAPTENDNYWRHQIVQGNVHDMAAAMLGGVSGHAGLFSTAFETGILMQMLLNQGNYGGVEYIKPATIKKFTTRYRKSSRRGLGFDMKELNNARSQNFSSYASARAFGHSGFTGCIAMADPAEELVIVITTNRTYPNSRNQSYNNNKYRILFQDIIYKAIVK